MTAGCVGWLGAGQGSQAGEPGSRGAVPVLGGSTNTCVCA